jgi:hypothetical protein
VFNVNNSYSWTWDNLYVIIQLWSLTQFSFAIWAGIVRDIVLGPHLLHCEMTFQRSCDVLVSVLLWLLEDVTVAASSQKNSRLKSDVKMFIVCSEDSLSLG